MTRKENAMEITEVRVKLMEDSDDRLRAFCSITFDDCFVIRDLKIIEGSNGPFVAMPSRKLTCHCPGCGCKNHLRAAHCNSCGLRLKDDRAIRDQEGRAKLYADIAHPINSACRELIQNRVIEEFTSEQRRATEPGYVSRYDDDFDMDYEFAGEPVATQKPAAESPAKSEELDPVASSSTSSLARAGQTHHVDLPTEEPRPPHSNPAARTQAGKDGEFGAGVF
jgi:stage V sporulation protein G